MYKPGFIIFLFILFIFLKSCSPVNYIKSENVENIAKEPKETIPEEEIAYETNQTIETEETIQNNLYDSIFLKKEILIILPNKEKSKASEQFINIIELATYDKKLQNISFKINFYDNKKQLEDLIINNAPPGQIFIGPLESNETKLLNNYCDKGTLFFSFASKRDLASDCVYLINFFPKNELEILFSNFPKGSKIAILYPENSYGYRVNELVDKIADQSDSIIINRASYSNDLTNVREAIKELGKYELRKYELNRQKQLLASKTDEKSKKRLKKLEKFQTTEDLDFTHVLLPDYGIRLLQVAPLLPYYDVDPNNIQFVGTGVWDDPVFFTEPSLQNSIFPGVEINKREELITKYSKIYNSKLMRTSTLPYDLIGLISYIFQKNMTLQEAYQLLNNEKTKFDGIDGRFYFRDNIIQRELNILQIYDGKAQKIN